MVIIVDKIPETPKECLFYQVSENHTSDRVKRYCMLSRKECTDTCACDKLQCITDFSFKPDIKDKDENEYRCRHCKFLHRDETASNRAIQGTCVLASRRPFRYGSMKACKKFELLDHLFESEDE